MQRIPFMKSVLSISLIVILAGYCAADLRAADTKATTVPILVELFTSEGCSSCPPADAWLLQMDTAQPVTGAQLIVLSEHVDYWDHDGWKDPYSSSLLTARQVDYERLFKLDSPYTPQVVINGTVNLALADSQKAQQAFQQASAAMAVPVSIRSATITPGNPAILHAQVEIDGGSVDRKADVYEVIALSHAESQVLHGENGGKRLSHVAVVQELTKIGKLEKGKTFSHAIEVKLKPGTDPKNVRLIVFAQEPGPGRVLGAALQDPIN
jgi:hypothetical protein